MGRFPNKDFNNTFLLQNVVSYVQSRFANDTATPSSTNTTSSTNSTSSGAGGANSTAGATAPRFGAGSENDPLLLDGSQWFMRTMGVQQAWQTTTGGRCPPPVSACMLAWFCARWVGQRFMRTMGRVSLRQPHAGASEVVVAVLDTGADLAHPDLTPSLWINKGEIPGNGVDDDGNGGWRWRYGRMASVGGLGGAGQGMSGVVPWAGGGWFGG